jgi:hypothetical protein|nr:hypothetical protein [Aeromicrobium sp.]
MNAGVRVLTLTVAALIFVAGGVVGVRLLTSGTGEAVAAGPTCTDSVVAAGSPLDSNVIKINVFNASARSGLANRVLINLQANGFLGGQIGNSTSATKPRKVAILTDDRDDPRVRLLAAQFKDKAEYAPVDITVTDGITVVVGDDYSGLKNEANTSIETDRDLRVCVPVVPLP